MIVLLKNKIKLTTRSGETGCQSQARENMQSEKGAWGNV